MFLELLRFKTNYICGSGPTVKHTEILYFWFNTKYWLQHSISSQWVTSFCTAFVSLPFLPSLNLKYRHNSVTCLHSTNSSYVALKWMRRNLRVILLNVMGLKCISGNVSSVSPNRCDVKYSKRTMLLLCWLMMTGKKQQTQKCSSSFCSDVSVVCGTLLKPVASPSLACTWK